MTLFKLNKDLDFEPRLAESWTVNSDSTLLTLVLRDDIKWSDGEKTTAKDVEFTVRIATHPQVPYPASSRFDRIQSVQALNDTTVQVKLESWYPDLFFDLNIPVLPEHILAAIPAAQIAQSEFNTQPVGNGPYKLKEWKANQHISFERNEYWPLKQPALSGIVFTILQDDMLLLSNLKNGHIHLAPHLNQTVFNQIKRIPSIRAVRSRSKSYSFIGWNCSQDRFEQKIRLALSRAINKKQIIDICLAGYAKPFRGPFLPESRYYNPELSGIPYNPNKAKQILVDEGWQDSNGDGILEKNNRPFELVLTINAASQLQKDIATVIQSQLSQIRSGGFNTTTGNQRIS
ncbi:MAG: ABC transporter substrate-binding protein [candidate division KSB1 bacterium]|nr:ABC transporter substrate-binding protein [candidate division KSB1 bacterium]